MKFAGTHTAIITPFSNGQFDEATFRKLVDFQFDNGVQGVVPCGTTGESPTLDHAEHGRVIQLAVEAAAGRGIVMAGTGSNSTREAIALTQEAESAGANASLQVAPYYNRPTPEGLFQHFKAIADNTKLPIMLYNVPGRCGVEIGVDVVERLAEACPNIRAIKEAGGNSDRVSQMKMLLPTDFEILSGDDSLTLPFMSVGAVGIVSVAGNLIPREMSQMVQHALKGQWTEALAIHAKFNPLFSAFLKLASNPIPIKTALALKGLAGAELRLPLCEMTAAQTTELKDIMVRLGLLSA